MTSRDVERGLPPQVANEPRRLAGALLALADSLQRTQRQRRTGQGRLTGLSQYVERLGDTERLQVLAGLQLLLPVLTPDPAARPT